MGNLARRIRNAVIGTATGLTIAGLIGCTGNNLQRETDIIENMPEIVQQNPNGFLLYYCTEKDGMRKGYYIERGIAENDLKLMAGILAGKLTIRRIGKGKSFSIEGDYSRLNKLDTYPKALTLADTNPKDYVIIGLEARNAAIRLLNKMY